MDLVGGSYWWIDRLDWWIGGDKLNRYEFEYFTY